MNEKALYAPKIYERVVAKIIQETPDFNRYKNAVIAVSKKISVVDGNMVDKIGISEDKTYLCVNSPLYDFRPHKIASRFVFFDACKTNEWYDVYVLDCPLKVKNNIRNRLTFSAIRRNMGLT